jgi:hypothetical protein
METIRLSESSVFKRLTCGHIPEDDILHSHCRENRKSYIVLTGWALLQRHSVSYEVRTRFYIPEDDILHSHRRENLKSYIALTSCALQRRRNIYPVKYELGLYIPEDDILHSHCRENLKSYIVLTGSTL